MARESTMKPSRAESAETPGNFWSSLTVMPDRRMLSTLGRDLQNVYGDVTDSAQPGDLLRLAALIDERRGHSDL